MKVVQGPYSRWQLRNDGGALIYEFGTRGAAINLKDELETVFLMKKRRLKRRRKPRKLSRLRAKRRSAC